MKRGVIMLGFLVMCCGFWELLVRLRIWSPVLLPSPGLVGQYLFSAIVDTTLFQAFWTTFRRLLIGYTTGLLGGIILGQLTARFPICQQTIGMMAFGLQTLPSVCWVPLALLWFGQTEGAIVFVVVMGSLWSISIVTNNGFRTLPPIYIRAARTLGSRGLHTVVYVVLPASLRFLVSGMKQGWAFAWRSLMAAEIYVTILSGIGLGHVLHYGRELHAMEQVIGIILVIVASGLLIEKLVFSPIEHALDVRWGTQTR